MSKDKRQTAERLDIALERIAAEKAARTGRLNLGNLGLTRPPPGLSDLDWLETLNLGGVIELFSTVLSRSDAGSWEETDEAYNPNHIEPIATWLTGLLRLSRLDCSGTDLQDLPALAECSALRSLDCSFTQVANLAPLAECSALEYLDCLGTQVAELSPLAGLLALQSLDCRSTRVDSLTPLAGCPALQSFSCSRTKVNDLNPLTKCSALRELDCWDTQKITDFPKAIIELSNLEELVINFHPGLGHIPSEVLSQGPGDNCLTRLRAHLADLDAGAELLRDLKVIVLGNGRIGKTQLCRRLRGEGFEADAVSTHGISVTSVELAMPADEEDAVMNLWDFGGQDIYHGTHALFMRTRAVFLLVWTPDSEQGDHEHGGLVFRNQPLPYWLEYIRHLGGDPGAR